MTADQYWNGDCQLVKAYREARKIQQKRKNEELWLQGMYIYEALCDVSPILRAFSKARKPAPYPEEPYKLADRKDEKAKKEDVNPAVAAFEAIAASWNASFKKKRGAK